MIFISIKRKFVKKIEKILIEEEKRKEVEKNDHLINIKTKNLEEEIKFKNSQLQYLEEQYQQTLLYCTSLSSELRLEFLNSEMYKVLHQLQKIGVLQVYILLYQKWEVFLILKA